MTKVAILIDGGFFLKRLRTVLPSVDRTDPGAVAKALRRLVESHLRHLHRNHDAKTPWALLYRAFYYDARPYDGKAHLPISKRPLDYRKTDSACFRTALFDELRRAPNFAVRLGDTFAERQWVLTEKAQKELIAGRRDWSSVTDDDFAPGIVQKAVDMRLGLDIASISLKRQASIIVLVAGDADFVPAAKLARREGVRIVLDPLWQKVRPALFEHIDGLYSGVSRPGSESDAGEEGE